MKISNIRIYTFLAIALGCALTSCPNEAARKEYNQRQSEPKIEVPSIIEIQELKEDNLDKQIDEIIKHR